MAVSEYLKAIDDLRRSGQATESSYRESLMQLIRALQPEINPINEPSHRACGAPDLMLTRGTMPTGCFIETKDIGISLDAAEKSDQLRRYFDGLDNVMLTDYLEFRAYGGGAKKTLRLAAIEDGKLKRSADGCRLFPDFFAEFCKRGVTVAVGANQLASMMAAKAQLLREAVLRALKEDAENSISAAKQLAAEHKAFSDILIKDLPEDQFADIFAQTVAYGLFAACSEASAQQKKNFSRKNAWELLPVENELLRIFFNRIAGPDMDGRISWIADSLAEMFRVCQLEEVLKEFGEAGGRDDPLIHFYETFLRHYDPKKRKSRGVYYTPEAVVDFIVRAADDSLRNDFNLDGLADSSKIKITVGPKDKREEKEIHRVQILDPATGTGTFLARTIRRVFDSFASNKGMWPEYARDDLIPRLHGFEYMMSAYAICHLKLGLVLAETGAPLSNGGRLGVYLTNSLEFADRDYGKGASALIPYLAEEGRRADQVKRDAPVMVVIGNPPYSISSLNRGEWIGELLGSYKEDLEENTINSLNDDYIKFIRFAEHFIEKNKSGIVGMITNNSFLDGVTHRQMRRHLLRTFDKIYILNLHGNARIKEIAPDGGEDKNVFDIRQGVSISVMIKTSEDESDAKVFYADCYGKRKGKYDFLLQSNLKSVEWETLSPCARYFFFTPKDFSAQKEYDKGIRVTDFFDNYNSGIQTKCDDLSVHFDDASLKAVVNDFLTLTVAQLKEKYYWKKDSSSWKFSKAKDGLMKKPFQYASILYRPFDTRCSVYTEISGGFIGRPSHDTMRHFANRDNIGLMTSRTIPSNHHFDRVFVTPYIADIHAASDQTYVFPLWFYDTKKKEVRPNFKDKVAKAFAEKIGMTFIPEEKQGESTVSPSQIFNYIYAILHSPEYRRKFAELLKIDFPHIPYPRDAAYFRRLSAIGGELRETHLLRSGGIQNAQFNFPEAGTNEIVKPRFADDADNSAMGRVFINGGQYFGGVLREAWDFCIGGYYPAQKWLKDRRGRKLANADIRHYCRILAALARTAELMREIDGV